MSSNYSYGLTYQCSNVNPRTGACGRVIVDVIARSRDMSQSALGDVMQHVDDLCVRPSEFHLVSHEGLFPTVAPFEMNKQLKAKRVAPNVCVQVIKSNIFQIRGHK